MISSFGLWKSTRVSSQFFKVFELTKTNISEIFIFERLIIFYFSWVIIGYNFNFY